MEVRLIRHFATEGNLEKRYIGVTDEEIKTECVPEYILKKEENRRIIDPERSVRILTACFPDRSGRPGLTNPRKTLFHQDA